jgi:hypothetical protein
MFSGLVGRGAINLLCPYPNYSDLNNQRLCRSAMNQAQSAKLKKLTRADENNAFNSRSSED